MKKVNYLICLIPRLVSAKVDKKLINLLKKIQQQIKTDAYLIHNCDFLKILQVGI